MGNNLIKGYEIQEANSCSGGLGNFWRVFTAKKLNSGGKLASVLRIEKKPYKRYGKNQQETLYSFFRKEGQQLAKFKHPGILSLMEPMIENEAGIAIVTEFITGSLSHFIANKQFGTVTPSLMDLKVHMLELLEGLQFLHNDSKNVHMAICPENIYITQEGKWKFAGLGFTINLASQTFMEKLPIDFGEKNYDSSVLYAPNIQYAAPEVIESKTCYYASDIFSLGLVFFSLLKMYFTKSTNEISLLSSNSIEGIKYNYNNIIRNSFQVSQKIDFMPKDAQQLIKAMLNPDPFSRASANMVLKQAFFNDPLLRILNFFPKLVDHDTPSQLKFLNNLFNIIEQYELTTIKQQIIPFFSEMVKRRQGLSPPILKTFFYLVCTEKVNHAEFRATLWPLTKELLKAKEIPAQTLYLIINYSLKLLEILPQEEFTETLVPILFKSYECGAEKIQVLAVRKTSGFLKKIHFQTVKNQLLPKIQKLILSPNIATRRAAVVFIRKNIEFFDKRLLFDYLLSSFETFRKNSEDKVTTIGLFELIKDLCKTNGNENASWKMLAITIPMLTDLTVGKQEFVQYIQLTQAVLKNIYDERMKGFQQGSIEESTISLEALEAEENTDNSSTTIFHPKPPNESELVELARSYDPTFTLAGVGANEDSENQEKAPETQQVKNQIGQNYEIDFDAMFQPQKPKQAPTSSSSGHSEVIQANIPANKTWSRPNEENTMRQPMGSGNMVQKAVPYNIREENSVPVQMNSSMPSGNDLSVQGRNGQMGMGMFPGIQPNMETYSDYSSHPSPMKMVDQNPHQMGRMTNPTNNSLMFDQKGLNQLPTANLNQFPAGSLNQFPPRNSSFTGKGQESYLPMAPSPMKKPNDEHDPFSELYSEPMIQPPLKQSPALNFPGMGLNQTQSRTAPQQLSTGITMNGPGMFSRFEQKPQHQQSQKSNSILDIDLL